MRRVDEPFVQGDAMPLAVVLDQRLGKLGRMAHLGSTDFAGRLELLHMLQNRLNVLRSALDDVLAVMPLAGLDQTVSHGVTYR